MVDGRVGSGKTVFALQLAYYLSDGKFNIDQVCFTPEQFKTAVLSCPKYGCVVFDEAFRGLSARAAMSETNRILISMLNEIRQKNLFVFIISPSCWDIDKYVMLHRCSGLFHIRLDNNMNRGYFCFYRRDKLTWMFANSHKMKYQYPAAPQFKGRFTKWMPLDLESYLKKKEVHLGDYGSTSSESKKEGEEVLTEIALMGGNNNKSAALWKYRCQVLAKFYIDKDPKVRTKLLDFAEMWNVNTDLPRRNGFSTPILKRVVLPNLLKPAKNEEKAPPLSIQPYADASGVETHNVKPLEIPNRTQEKETPEPTRTTADNKQDS